MSSSAHIFAKIMGQTPLEMCFLLHDKFSGFLSLISNSSFLALPFTCTILDNIKASTWNSFTETDAQHDMMIVTCPLAMRISFFKFLSAATVVVIPHHHSSPSSCLPVLFVCTMPLLSAPLVTFTKVSELNISHRILFSPRLKGFLISARYGCPCNQGHCASSSFFIRPPPLLITLGKLALHEEFICLQQLKFLP